MKNHTLRCTLIAFLLLGNFVVAIAQTAPKDKTDEIKKKITAIYKEIDEASNHKQIAVTVKYLAPDYIQVGATGGTLTKAQLIVNTQQLMEKAETVTGKTTINELTVKDNTVTAEIDVDGTITTVRSDGIKSTLQVIASAREFWVKSKAGWQLKRSRVKSQKVLMNGEEIAVPSSPSN